MKYDLPETSLLLWLRGILLHVFIGLEEDVELCIQSALDFLLPLGEAIALTLLQSESKTLRMSEQSCG